MDNYITDLECFMVGHEIVLDHPLIKDGRLHRIHIKGDRSGTKNGWYIYHQFPFPICIFGSWKTGEKYLWSSKSQELLTRKDRALLRKQAKCSAELLYREKLENQEKAQKKAAYIWGDSVPAPNNNPYLLRKNVCSYGLRLYKSALVVPMHDLYGRMCSLQFIDEKGEKRFLSGGRKAGCFFTIGKIESTLCIAEGYATAASIHEATGNPVAVAFDAGNLLGVSLNLRIHLPKTRIIVCADNDFKVPGNPGLKKQKKPPLPLMRN